MIAIQILLIIAVASLFVWFISNPRSHQVRAWTKILTFFLVVSAIIAIIFPNAANTVAHWVGVGRGADLLLYVLALAFIYYILNSYIREKEQQRRFVELTRRAALLEAKLDKKK